MTHMLEMKPQVLGLLLVLGIAGWWVAIGSHDLMMHDYNIGEVELEQARQLIDSGALVIDVRDKEKFDYRHIPGAIVIPLVVLRAGIPASLESAKDKKIVIYCNRGRHQGPEATHILNQAGYTNAVNLKSGIEGWAEAGLPIEKG